MNRLLLACSRSQKHRFK